MKFSEHAILLGSTFPLMLIRRRVVIEPVAVDTLRRQLVMRQVVSFWGHANTVAVANALLGIEVAPETVRPALTTTPEGYPALVDHVFDECWILSPDYAPGFRPAIGEEVTPDKIIGWQTLRLKWEELDNAGY